jgi:hypothetical protein
VLPIEIILTGVEEAIVFLPEEAAKEVQQETVQILKAASKPMYKLSGTERRDLWALHANNVLAVLPADKSNVTVVLNTKDYEKITTLLRAPTYRRLPKDPTEERKTTVLLKRL